MVDRPITVGLVGLGSLGIRLGEQFAELSDSELVAIADVNEEILADAGEELGVPDASRYQDYETMLDSESLDAVAIATPNGLHYDQTLAALERDLHVLVEKPLATSVEDAYEVTQRAEASDRERSQSRPGRLQQRPASRPTVRITLSVTAVPVHPTVGIAVEWHCDSDINQADDNSVYYPTITPHPIISIINLHFRSRTLLVEVEPSLSRLSVCVGTRAGPA